MLAAKAFLLSPAELAVLYTKAKQKEIGGNGFCVSPYFVQYEQFLQMRAASYFCATALAARLFSQLVTHSEQEMSPVTFSQVRPISKRRSTP